MNAPDEHVTNEAQVRTLQTLQQRMALAPGGNLTIDGVPTIVIPASVFTNLQKASERILGRGFPVILYSSGENLGREMATVFRGLAGPSAPSSEIFSTVVREGVVRGFGTLEPVKFDWQAGRGLFRIHHSPFAVNPDTVSCHFAAGFWGDCSAA